MLRIKNLRVSHGPIEAVHGISFEVRAGQCVSLLGPNGAGKTSTISAITGLAKTRGEIFFEDKEISAWPVEKRVRAGISVSPEGRRVFANLTVAENLVLGGALRRDTAEKTRDVTRWLETFPVLGERRRQAAGTLSGGEQQMLAIARALMNRPRILLLDEPSLGLAPQVVRRVFKMIEDLKQNGMTILLVEQNAAQALKLADHACLLNSGQITARGTAENFGRGSELMASLTGIA